jgi:Rhs element Vgr protein
MMAESPLNKSGEVVQFKITSNGTALTETVQVVSIVVHLAIGKIPSAEIVVLDGDMPNQVFPVSDGDTLTPGSEIVIEAGYENATDIIFKGVVIRHGLRITADNNARLTIDCRDKAVAMTVGRKNAFYVNMKDSDIFSKIVARYSGISCDSDDTNTEHKELVQHYCTDWDFLASRAEANGMVVMTDQNKITIKTPQAGGSAELSVTYGEDLMEFHGDIDCRTQLASVKSVVWDPATQQIVEQTSSPKDLDLQGDLDSSTLAKVLGLSAFRLQTPAAMAETAVQSWADSQQTKSGLARVRGRVKFQGSAKAKLGGLIQLKGVGARFTGNVFVGSVTHELAEGHWTTEVESGVASERFTDQRDLAAPAAAGLLPGIEGLQIGVVKKLDEDPGGENRIQVSIPLLQAETDGVWARLSNFYASKTFGDYFIPEIGDEVLLGYLNNDPSNPVILGSLYSSNRTPPYPMTAENNTKAIVTRSLLRVIFDDDKKEITIITPAKNKIVLSDDSKSIALEDQNGNKVHLDPQGILLDSPKDITVNAKGKIVLSAVGEISATAQADVVVTGLNVTNTAQVGFTAKGSATAELSASGQTTVRGALVMIN